MAINKAADLSQRWPAFVPKYVRWHNGSMLQGLLQRIFNTGSVSDPTRAKEFFLWVQLAFGAVILGLIYLATRGKRGSGFRVRESDKKPAKPPKSQKSDDSLANARIRKTEPLKLPGIRIEGEPHEILGLSRAANANEVQNAYRELMKRYHPDVVGRQGTREWSDAQKIAEALNHARSKMLAEISRRPHSQSPKRSGR